MSFSCCGQFRTPLVLKSYKSLEKKFQNTSGKWLTVKPKTYSTESCLSFTCLSLCLSTTKLLTKIKISKSWLKTPTNFA